MRPSPRSVPIDTRSQPSGPVSRISTPRSSRPCQTACRSANVAEQHEVRVRVRRGQQPDPRSHVDGAVALGPQLGDARPAARRRAPAPPGPPPASPPTGGTAAGRCAPRPRRPAPRPGSRAGRRRTRTPCYIVRVTTSRGCAAAGRARSARRPGGTRRRPRRRRPCRARPRRSRSTSVERQRGTGRVVRRGEQHDRRAACSRSARRRAARSSVKSSRRRPTTQSVCVSRAYSGYIE